MQNIDENIYQYFRAHESPFWEMIFRFFSFMADPIPLFILSVIVFMVFWLNKERKKSMIFLFIMIFGFFGETFMKITLQRSRPEEGLKVYSDFSFPSGHATMATIFFGFLLLILLGKFSKNWQKFLITTTAIGSIFMVGLSRLYLGYHWSSDVLAGVGIGAILLTVIHYRTSL